MNERGDKEMFEKIKELVAENLGVDAGSITEESSFKDDLGADSLDLFELVMALGRRVRYRDPNRGSGADRNRRRRYFLY